MADDGNSPKQQIQPVDAAAAAPGTPAAVSQAALRKAERYIEVEEGATNHLVGWSAIIVTGIAVAMSVFHLYTAIAGVPPIFSEFPIVPTQPLR